MTIPARFRWQAEHIPEHDFLGFTGEKAITYGEAALLVDALIAFLEKAGIAKLTLMNLLIAVFLSSGCKLLTTSLITSFNMEYFLVISGLLIGVYSVVLMKNCFSKPP